MISLQLLRGHIPMVSVMFSDSWWRKKAFLQCIEDLLL